MAMAVPIAIGTRGTVGALVRKEIEFFAQRRDQPERPSTAKAAARHVVHGNWGSLGGLLVGTWRRKKHRGFLPSLCSAAEVVEIGIPGFGYTALREHGAEA